MNGEIGLFGGTFNPVHVGHLRAAEEVAELLGLARVLFVPAADPPLKRGGAQSLAPARERLAWVEAAVEGNARFEVSAVELERDGPSFTVDTLAILRERLAPESLVFIVGQDAFVEIDVWREPERIARLANLAVMTRPPGGGFLADWLPESLRGSYVFSGDGQSARHREAGTWIRRLAISAFDVSATDVRRRLRAGRSIRYLVPEAVREAVEKCDAYRGTPAPAGPPR